MGMSGSTLEIALQERFGFNLWQIAAGIAAHGESALFCVPARSNLGKYAHFLRRVRLTWGRDDVTRPPHYAEGHVYSVNNFAGVNMRDYIRPQCIRSACTIIHIRGGDYLTHMPPALQILFLLPFPLIFFHKFLLHLKIYHLQGKLCCHAQFSVADQVLQNNNKL